MATRRFTPNAAPVFQVDTLTIGGTWLAGETVTITIANVAFVVTIGSLVTTAQVATTIKQAFNGETLTDTSASCIPTIAQSGAQAIATFAEIGATVSSSVVTFTGKTAGKPYVLATTEGSTSGTVSDASVTVAVGPSFFSEQDNWSGNTVPVDTDTIVVDQGSGTVLFGLTPAIQPAAVEIPLSFLGKIGMAAINVDTTSKPYTEYRTDYLTFDDNSATTTYTIGHGSGGGSGRLKINAGAGQCVWVVRGSGTREIASTPCVLLKGTHASNELNNWNGDVGVAFYAGETSVIATLRTGNGVASSAQTYCGAGVTLSSCTITMNGGTMTTNSAVSTVTISNGVWTHRSGNVATLNVDGGTVYWEAGSATITTLKVGTDGIFDKSRDSRPLTVTNAVQLYKGATVNDPDGTITFSGGFKLNRCRLEDVTLDLGPDKTYTVT